MKRGLSSTLVHSECKKRLKRSRPLNVNAVVLGEIAETMIERELIRKRREAGEKIWTNDIIFQKYRFCNVHRQHDRGTVFLLERLKGMCLEDQILHATVYRLFNLPATYDKIMSFIGWGKAFLVGEAIASLNLRQKLKLRIFSSAYIVAPIKRGIPKHQSILEHLAENATFELRDRIKNLKTSQDTYNLVSELAYKSQKSFINYQICCDLALLHPHIYNLDNHVVFGPGTYATSLSLLGIKVLKREGGLVVRDLLKTEVAKRGQRELSESITLQTVEHWFCEHRKYLQHKNGTKKGKRRLYARSD